MSVQNNIAGGESVVLERPAVGGVYMPLLTFLTTNLLADWDGYYVFFQINHFSPSMINLEEK
ncbi:TPA: hypothetical protein ACH1TP_001035 [Enterobacter roggenkampii]|nr:hypothetical protein [Enterobacter roggenkampii]MDQ2219735.1 hypothetical protein [Enterobacter roggenkampii]